MKIYSVKKTRITLFWGALISFSFFVASLLFFIFLRDRNMHQAYLASCSLELITLAYSVALFITVFLDKAPVTEETRWLFIMAFLITVLLFCDIVSWIINDRAEYRFLNILMYDVAYILSTFLILAVWKLIRVALSLKGAGYRRIDRFILALFVLDTLIVLTNPFTGLLYRVKATGLEYSETEVIYILLDTVILLINLIVVLRSPKKGEEKIAAIVLAVSPLVGIVITELASGFECTYPLYFISVLFSFVCIYSGRTQELETKEKDLKFAASIQLSLIPDKPVTGQFGTFEVCGIASQAGEIGGDFFDYFMIDDDHLAFLVGDVCEEGVPAALCMMQTVSTLHDFITAGFRCGEVFSLANKRLSEHNRVGFFASCWLGILNTDTGLLECINAGHRPPLLLRADGSRTLLKTAVDAPLAAVPDTVYSEACSELNKGDMLILCTDGVYASFSKSRASDPSGLIAEKALEDSNGLEALCRDIIELADRNVPEGPEKEDMTVLAIRFNGVGAGEAEL